MFDIFVPEMGARWKNTRKALTLSLSLALHALLIAAVIVVPLLRAEANLPAFKSTEVRIGSPILPGVPPGPGRHRRGDGGTVPPKGRKPEGPKSGPPEFRVPIEVPVSIEDDDPTTWIEEGPGGPGIDDADPNSTWKMGGEIKTDEINPAAVTITTVRPPRLIKRVNPEYPPIALVSRVSGKVEIVASTDIYGRVLEARVTSGNALLNGAALEAVKKWIYEPYLVNGIPRPVRFTVTITFSLETR